MYSAPLAAHDTRQGDATKEDFRKITDKKGITNGELWDLAKEMSAARATKQGVDPVKETFYRNYERQFGEKHAEEKKRIATEKAIKSAAQFGITLE